MANIYYIPVVRCEYQTVLPYKDGPVCTLAPMWKLTEYAVSLLCAVHLLGVCRERILEAERFAADGGGWESYWLDIKTDWEETYANAFESIAQTWRVRTPLEA